MLVLLPLNVSTRSSFVRGMYLVVCMNACCFFDAVTDVRWRGSVRHLRLYIALCIPSTTAVRLPVLRLLLPVGRDVGGQGRGRGRRGAGRGRRGRGAVGGGGGGDPRPVGAVGGRRLGSAAAVQLGAAEAGAAALDAARRAGRRSRAGRGAGPAR